MSQQEAWARERAGRTTPMQQARTVARRVATWTFPVLGALVLALGGASLLGDHGASDQAEAERLVGVAQQSTDDARSAYDDALAAAVRAGTGADAARTDEDAEAASRVLQDAVGNGSLAGEAPKGGDDTVVSFDAVLVSASDGTYTYTAVAGLAPQEGADASSWAVMHYSTGADGAVEVSDAAWASSHDGQ